MVPPSSNRGFFGNGRWALDLQKKTMRTDPLCGDGHRLHIEWAEITDATINVGDQCISS